jgi:hypothetical protein
MRTQHRRAELIFQDALKAFLEQEGDALTSDVSERSTCARLAIHLERQFQVEALTGYYADVEYNRKQEGRVKTIVNTQLQVVAITPDLIVHSRGEKAPPHDNLIAVEAKKVTRPAHERYADHDRLKAMTRTPFEGVWPHDGSHPEHVCGYSVGIYLEIDSAQRRVHLDFFKKGSLTNHKTLTF